MAFNYNKFISFFPKIKNQMFTFMWLNYFSPCAKKERLKSHIIKALKSVRENYTFIRDVKFNNLLCF